MIAVIVTIIACVLAAAGIAFAILVAKEMRRMRRMNDAQASFPFARERLQGQFFGAAALSGKPRGLIWEKCEFDDDVLFARDRETRRVTALVGVTIRFSAVKGGELEDNPNVANLRAATAVFQYDGLGWITNGRVLFNLTPAEALEHLSGALEPLAKT